MADPATLAITTLIVGGSVGSAVSQIRAGSEQSKILKKNAQIAEQEAALISETARNNAAIIEAEAERARYVKREEAREKRRETRRLLASQIVRYAKSGVVAGVGTPLIVSEESKKQWGRQAAIINEQGVYEYEYGMSRAASLLVEAEGRAGLSRSQASIFRKQAKSVKRASRIGAFTTLATSLASTYLLTHPGIFSDTSFGFGRAGGTTALRGKTIGQAAKAANKWLWAF